MSALPCPVSVIYSGIVARGMLLLPSAWMTFSRARTLTRRRGNEQETTIRHVAPIQPYSYEDQSRETYFESTCNAIDTVFRAWWRLLLREYWIGMYRRWLPTRSTFCTNIQHLLPCVPSSVFFTAHRGIDAESRHFGLAYVVYLTVSPHPPWAGHDLCQPPETVSDFGLRFCANGNQSKFIITYTIVPTHALESDCFYGLTKGSSLTSAYITIVYTLAERLPSLTSSKWL